MNQLAIETGEAEFLRTARAEMMTGSRKPKKSETIEIRLPHDLKSALMDKAHGEGRSASAVIRESIHHYLVGQPKETRSMILTMLKPAAAIGAASLALMWTALAPAPTQATTNLKSAFQMLDRNRDGAITLQEFVTDSSDPAVVKMHHAHMTGAQGKQMASAHAQMMATAHAKPDEQELRSHFAQLDANSDGSISFSEFKAFHDKMKSAHGH